MSMWLRVVWCGFGVVWIWCGLFARRWCLHGVLCKCGNRRNRILICTLASIWNIWDWLRDRDRNPSGSKRLTKDLLALLKPRLFVSQDDECVIDPQKNIRILIEAVFKNAKISVGLCAKMKWWLNVQNLHRS